MDKPYLSRGEGRTRRGHDILDTRLVHRQYIGVALDQVAAALLLDGTLGLVDTVELVALVVDVRLGRVEVFAYLHARFKYPAAKGAIRISIAVHGKHYPAGKQVVDASVLAFATQSRFEQELCLVASFLGLLGQCVTLLWRIAKPELADNIFVEAPFPEIGHTHRAPLFGLQQRMAEKLLGKSVDHKHAFAFGSLLFLFVGQLLFMNLDIVFLGQVLQRFVIGELLVLHDKVYGTAAFPQLKHLHTPFDGETLNEGDLSS